MFQGKVCRLLSFAARSSASRTALRSSGCVRFRIVSSDGGKVGSRSKILNVSSDQNSSPLATFQPKLPVWAQLLGLGEIGDLTPPQDVLALEPVLPPDQAGDRKQRQHDNDGQQGEGAGGEVDPEQEARE